jgi:hypothetical protein
MDFIELRSRVYDGLRAGNPALAVGLEDKSTSLSVLHGGRQLKLCTVGEGIFIKL